jgi:hypothetical protein
MRARILAFVLMAACSEGGPSGDDGGPQQGPPAARVPPELPAEIESSLPHTDDGLPILLDVPTEAIPGFKLQLVFDATLDDPITRWGECLARVMSCYKTNDRVSSCIETQIEICADDQGGNGCCPRACIEEYARLHDEGASEDEAVENSVILGDCIPGFAEMVNGGGT